MRKAALYTAGGTLAALTFFGLYRRVVLAFCSRAKTSPAVQLCVQKALQCNPCQLGCTAARHSLCMLCICVPWGFAAL